MDDRWKWYHAPGNAEGRLCWTHARVSAVGESPSSLKMTAPRYQDVKSGDIPIVVDDDGTVVRVICGNFWGKAGPVDGIAAEPVYLDVSVPREKEAFACRHLPERFRLHFAGSGTFRDASKPLGSGSRRKSMEKNLTSATCPATARWSFSTVAMR